MESIYLFIDGAYLQNVHRELIRPMWDAEPELDLLPVKSSFPSHKVFYYDCLDDVERPNEKPEEYRARVDAQQARFNYIQSLPGFHVRLGTVTGSKPKRLRQKEVDVQLAVDMLTHAFHKNMSRAILIAGDLDFRPVVNALIELGTYVSVVCASNTAAKGLFWAADESREITLDMAHSWCDAAFLGTHQLPIRSIGGSLPPGPSWVKTRSIRGYEVTILSGSGAFYALISYPYATLHVTHCDLSTLERYLELTEGHLET